MPFCPKCKCEYREGFSECTDCDEILIDSLPNFELPKENDHEVYLKTVSTDIDAEMLIGMLSHEGIPVRKKYRECGDYLTVFMGKTVMGIDLFVPSRLYKKAWEISNFEAQAISEDELCNLADSTVYGTATSTFIDTASTLHETTASVFNDTASTPNETTTSTFNDTASTHNETTASAFNDTASTHNETTASAFNGTASTFNDTANTHNETSTSSSTIANRDYPTYNAAEMPRIDTNKYVDSYIKRQRTVQLILLIVFISPILIGLLVSLYFLIKHLF